MLARFEVSISVTENGRNSPKYRLDTDLNGEVTLESLLRFTKQSLIVIADQALKEEQAKGFDLNPLLIVDNKPNKPIQSVSPLGQIEFISRVKIDNILLDAYNAILERSAVDTGKYKSSHYVFLNGSQVASSLESLKAWLATNPPVRGNDLLRIVNIQPYARRLERLGVTAQRTQSRRVKSRDEKKRSGINGEILTPNGTYFLAQRAIRRKYKRNSGIKFGFISGSSLGIGGSFKQKSGSSAKPSKYLYPYISILVSERGTA